MCLSFTCSALFRDDDTLNDYYDNDDECVKKPHRSAVAVARAAEIDVITGLGRPSWSSKHGLSSN